MDRRKWIGLTSRLVGSSILSALLIAAPLALVKNGSVAAYAYHDLVVIIGDSGFTNASGVTSGSGSISDPYIIEGWQIDAPPGATGIEIRNTDAYFVIRDSLISGQNGVGVLLWKAAHGSVHNISCSGFARGIFSEESDGVTLGNNTCSGNLEGIYLSRSNRSTLSGNTCSANEYGIVIDSSRDDLVIDNACWGNDFGVLLSSAYNVELSGNAMTKGGLAIEGSLQEHYDSHDIDNSNTINGMTIEYHCNESGGVMPLGAGQVVLVNCSSIVVENQAFADVGYGVLIAFSSNITVANNTFVNAYVDYLDEYGIYLLNSSGNLIADNTCLNCDYWIIAFNSDSNRISFNDVASEFAGIFIGGSERNLIDNNTCAGSIEGIWLVDSDFNELRNNSCLNNGVGMDLQSSDYNLVVGNTCLGSMSEGIHISTSVWNTIRDNTCFNGNSGLWITSSTNNSILCNNMSENGCGIRVEGCGGNWIYLNSFFGNRVWNAYSDSQEPNSWNTPVMVTYYYDGQLNTGYLGNYYGDYAGADTDADGVGEIPYVVGTELDYYPITNNSFEVIPEFSFQMMPILLVLVVLGNVWLLRKKLS